MGETRQQMTECACVPSARKSANTLSCATIAASVLPSTTSTTSLASAIVVNALSTQPHGVPGQRGRAYGVGCGGRPRNWLICRLSALATSASAAGNVSVMTDEVGFTSAEA